MLISKKQHFGGGWVSVVQTWLGGFVVAFWGALPLHPANFYKSLIKILNPFGELVGFDTRTAPRIMPPAPAGEEKIE